MKVFEYLIDQDLFVNKKELKLYSKKVPDMVKHDMINTLKEYNIGPDFIKSRYLNYKDYKGKECHTLDQLLDLEIYRFTPKVIVGGGKPSAQLELENFIRFTPKVIKQTAN